jgi:hypothetical protein
MRPSKGLNAHVARQTAVASSVTTTGRSHSSSTSMLAISCATLLSRLLATKQACVVARLCVVWAVPHVRVRAAQSLYALEVRNSSNMGRYLACGAPVPKGQIVMCLPPNLLLTEAELENPEQVLQVAPDLFSSSFSMDDLDNYLNHACDPTTRAVIREDFTIDLYTTRDLVAGDAITIDYELFEDDLISQGVDFKCECGSPLCRWVCWWQPCSGLPGCSRVPGVWCAVVCSGRIVGAQVRKQLYPQPLDALPPGMKDASDTQVSTCCGAGSGASVASGHAATSSFPPSPSDE